MRGFSGTATNLVVSLPVNLIISSFLSGRPRSRSLPPLFPEPPPPLFIPLVSYLPPHFSIAPLRFPPIDPSLCFQPRRGSRFLLRLALSYYRYYFSLNIGLASTVSIMDFFIFFSQNEEDISKMLAKYKGDSQVS